MAPAEAAFPQGMGKGEDLGTGYFLGSLWPVADTQQEGESLVSLLQSRTLKYYLSSRALLSPGPPGIPLLFPSFSFPILSPHFFLHLTGNTSFKKTVVPTSSSEGLFLETLSSDTI